MEFKKIVEPFRGVLLDAFGVFWGGDAKGAIPGSLEAMRYLVDSGKTVGILSNSTQLPLKEMHKISAHEFMQGVHYHFFVTSGEIARKQFLKTDLPFETPRHTYFVLGDTHSPISSHPYLFEGTKYKETFNLDEADFIYAGIPRIENKDQLSVDVFLPLIEKAVKTGRPMLCTNPDMRVYEGNPPQAVIRQGSLAEEFSKLGGKVFYIGKPYSNVYEAAMFKFNDYQIFEKSEVLMIGDTPETDIRGAKQFGMKALLLTETGMFAERIEREGLDVATAKNKDLPDYYLGKFNL